MKIFAKILNVLMICAIFTICVIEGVPKDSGLLLIIASIISFNIINILAINKNPHSVIKIDKEKRTSKPKSMKQFGIILVFVGLFLPSATYPLTTVDEKIHNIQVYSAMNGKEYSPSLKELRLGYSNYNYISYKYIVFIGIVSVFVGGAFIVKEVFFESSKSNGNMPNKPINQTENTSEFN